MAHAPGMIDLKGSKDPRNRLTLMTALLSSVDAKVNHFDGLRQRNLVLAMAIFAGLSGFSLRADHGLQAVLTALALVILMALFWCLITNSIGITAAGNIRAARQFSHSRR